MAALGPVCLDLPGAYEEPAWVGTRWRVGRHTFAHVLAIADGRPNAYALAAGSRGPLTVLTVRTSEPERYQGGRARRPFFWPGWFPDLLGRVLETPVDRAAIAPLLLESYCVVAPRRLVRELIGRSNDRKKDRKSQKDRAAVRQALEALVTGETGPVPGLFRSCGRPHEPASQASLLDPRAARRVP